MARATIDKRDKESDAKEDFSSRKIAREKMEKRIAGFIASKRLLLDERIITLIKNSDNPAKFYGELVKFSVISHVFEQARTMIGRTAVAEDALAFMEKVDGFVSEEQFSKPLSLFMGDFGVVKQHLSAYSAVAGIGYVDIKDIKSHAKIYLDWIREDVLKGENRHAWKAGFRLRDDDPYMERIEAEAEREANELARRYGHVDCDTTKYYDRLFAEFRKEKEQLLNEKIAEFKSMEEGREKDELLDKIALSWYACDMMQTMYNRCKRYGAGVVLISAEAALEKVGGLVSREGFGVRWKEFYERFLEETYVPMRAHSYLLMRTSKRTDIDGRMRIEDHYFDFMNPAYDRGILEAERKRVLYEAKS